MQELQSLVLLVTDQHAAEDQEAVRDTSQGHNPDNHIESRYAPVLLTSMEVDSSPHSIPATKANGNFLPNGCGLQELEKLWLVQTLEYQLL